VFRLKLGQRAGDKVRRIRLAKGDRHWDAVVDGSELLTRTATATSPGKPSIKRLATPEAAAKAFDAAVAAARAKGYRK
jgi:predicted DNA-binding WGR domain protein